MKVAHINPILQRTAQQPKMAGETLVGRKETKPKCFFRGETCVFTAGKKWQAGLVFTSTYRFHIFSQIASENSLCSPEFLLHENYQKQHQPQTGKYYVSDWDYKNDVLLCSNKPIPCLWAQIKLPIKYLFPWSFITFLWKRLITLQPDRWIAGHPSVEQKK